MDRTTLLMNLTTLRNLHRALHEAESDFDRETAILKAQLVRRAAALDLNLDDADSLARHITRQLKLLDDQLRSPAASSSAQQAEATQAKQRLTTSLTFLRDLWHAREWADSDRRARRAHPPAAAAGDVGELGEWERMVRRPEAKRWALEIVERRVEGQRRAVERKLAAVRAEVDKAREAVRLVMDPEWVPDRVRLRFLLY
ncbi:hypothetical protein MFIFM68171_02359 [Madurella fahalii]|uniref:Uncharacterized protein n=1 Tax=Madurella fahalii TaxID=1157608 RepID=A0ABQ0G392_9PEZI